MAEVTCPCCRQRLRVRDTPLFLNIGCPRCKMRWAASSLGIGSDEAVLNYYEVLQVSEAACSEVIRSAYHCLAKLNHPDLNRRDVRAVERMKLLNVAVEVLSNSQTRSEHDEGLATHRRKAAKSAEAKMKVKQASEGGSEARSTASQPSNSSAHQKPRAAREQKRPRCPKCGFIFGWNGKSCSHCNFTRLDI